MRQSRGENMLLASTSPPPEEANRPPTRGRQLEAHSDNQECGPTTKKVQTSRDQQQEYATQEGTRPTCPTTPKPTGQSQQSPQSRMPGTRSQPQSGQRSNKICPSLTNTEAANKAHLIQNGRPTQIQTTSQHRYMHTPIDKGTETSSTIQALKQFPRCTSPPTTLHAATRCHPQEPPKPQPNGGHSPKCQTPPQCQTPPTTPTQGHPRCPKPRHPPVSATTLHRTKPGWSRLKEARELDLMWRRRLSSDLCNSTIGLYTG
ncbi:hypothetical protein CRENBAI_023410 [Crenichthys baileyi]|uniref:Uncharacterized protein n=1 Tax=Crenichthys baileyi TaxID=28760 RepID=A0AAV9R922_9TELE